jgi:selenoprotein W-related protein
VLKLKQKLAAIRLIPSTGGVFEIGVNGQNIYSKRATGKFPDQDAIVKAIMAKA